MRVPSDRKENIQCSFCEHEIELSERDLRWIDAEIPHGDTRFGEVHVRPPFNFGCQSCETVFTYDYNPPVPDGKPVPLLQSFYVEQVACESCGSLVHIIVMSPLQAKCSDRKTWKQSWVEHKPWHRSA